MNKVFFEFDGKNINREDDIKAALESNIDKKDVNATVTVFVDTIEFRDDYQINGLEEITATVSNIRDDGDEYVVTCECDNKNIILVTIDKKDDCISYDIFV